MVVETLEILEGSYGGKCAGAELLHTYADYD